MNIDFLKTKKDIFLILLIFLCTGNIASAEPLVIRDYGGRDSGVPNLVALAKQAEQKKFKAPPFDDAARYPIVSTLKPGYFNAPQKLRNPVKGAKPFFVIGNDAFSRDWIEKNKNYLLDIGAQGLATNIQSKANFLELSAFVKPLPLVAIPVDEIAQILRFSVYPVLITGEEVAQ